MAWRSQCVPTQKRGNEGTQKRGNEGKPGNEGKQERGNEGKRGNEGESGGADECYRCTRSGGMFRRDGLGPARFASKHLRSGLGGPGGFSL